MMNGRHILEGFPTAVAAAATRQVASKLKKQTNKHDFWAVNHQRVIVVVTVDRFQNFPDNRHGV
jgi:hypothetical protein